MTYKLFLFIACCLQFDDQSTMADRHTFDKLSAISLHFLNNSRASYNVNELTTVDQTREIWYFIHENNTNLHSILY